jgi:branched-subunit amino acid ABC-type transport system permease component
MSYWAGQVANGLAFAIALYLLAVGLTLAFGVLRVVNLMHGSCYLLGAYIALSATEVSHNFLIGALIAVAAAVPVWLVLSGALKIAGRELKGQAVVTLALVYIISDVALVFWGRTPRSVPTPTALQGTVDLLGAQYPAYRLFLVGVGVVVAACLHVVQRRTIYGAVVRAAADDMDMLAALGWRASRVRAWTLLVAVALAMLSGAVAGTVFGVYPGVDRLFLVYALVVVILGGMGSITGSLIAALVVGVVSTVTKSVWPSAGDLSIFALVILVLAWRPAGLLGRRS